MLQTPLVFADELRDDAFVLQFRGQDFPGVGFKFEVRAELRVFAEHIQQFGQVVGGVVEERRGRAVQRDVEMDAPLRRVDS